MQSNYYNVRRKVVMKEKHKISKKLLFAWPTKGMAITIITLLAGYTTYFATDYLNISPATAGIIFMISKIFDGFTDIIAGYIIDRTNTKLGKGRPYELAFIGFAVCNALLFSAPQMNYLASCIYLFVMYSFVNSVFLTFLNCNEAVYMANTIEHPSEAVTLSSANGTASLIVGVITGMVLPQIVKNYGNTRAGWIAIGWGVAVLSTALAMVRFAIVKEKKQKTVNQEKLTIMDLLRAITSNRYILIIAVAILVCGIGNGVALNIVTYYAQYILGDVGAQSILALANLAVILGLILIPAFTRKFGTIKVLKFTTLLGIVGYAGRLIKPDSLIVIFTTTLLASFGFTVLSTFVSVFVIDCMDYSEWKTGRRSEGALTCAQSVTAKIGAAVGSGMIGILMGLSGYDGKLAVQTPEANYMIIILYTVVPAVCCILQYILLHMFDLEEKLPQIRLELEEKRKLESVKND